MIYLQIGKFESEILDGGQVLLSKLLCDLWQEALTLWDFVFSSDRWV